MVAVSITWDAVLLIGRQIVQKRHTKGNVPGIFVVHKLFRTSSSPSFLTFPLKLWSTFLNVMRFFSPNAIVAPVVAGVVAIPVLRISGHKARAGSEA